MIKCLLILPVLILTSSCHLMIKKKKHDEVPYVTPPVAPIPPENYCYESNTGNKAQLQLTIAGDSVFGKLESETSGTFTGIVYSNTLLITYNYDIAGAHRSEEREWKLAGDSIYEKPVEPVQLDSGQAAAKITSPLSMHKVPCR